MMINRIRYYDDISSNEVVPPPISPTYWRDRIDEAEQAGYIDGYYTAENTRGIRMGIIFTIGALIGFLSAFFMFYRG